MLDPLSEGYRLVPPISIKAKWNPAVKAIALMRLALFASASVLGIAVCCPTFKLGTARSASENESPRSGFLLSDRYRPQKLVSTVSLVRLVSRPFLVDPVAILPCNVRK